MIQLKHISMFRVSAPLPPSLEHNGTVSAFPEVKTVKNKVKILLFLPVLSQKNGISYGDWSGDQSWRNIAKPPMSKDWMAT
jgi:hypothetical protein